MLAIIPPSDIPNSLGIHLWVFVYLSNQSSPLPARMPHNDESKGDKP
jgi:hypothetical protein